MPVIPSGIEPFVITAPLTSGDLGEPSSSVKKDTKRVFDFITDERHLTAEDLLKSVNERIDTWQTEQDRQEAEKAASPRSRGSFNRLRSSRKLREKEAEEALVNSEYEQAKALLEQNEAKLEVLGHRCRLFRLAQKNLTEDEEWTLASSHFGIDTYYRREEDGTLSLKLEGEMTDLPLFEQVAVLKEVDLHYKWAPFCSSSMTVADLDKLDTVGWFMIGLSSFGLARDGCFRVIGCDNIHEDGSFVLAGQGIRDVKPGAPQPVDTYLCDDPIVEELPIPPHPSRRGADRMTIRKFDGIVKVLSPSSAVLKLVANIDPNISFLPQSLLEFIMKQVCGLVLAKLQSAAKKVVKNPVTNEHAKRMREEEDFYKRWLMAKFEAVCELKGWEMPPVKAFELTEEQLAHERKHSRVHADNVRRGVTFSDSSPQANSGDDSAPEDDVMSEVSELTSRSGLSWKRPLRTFTRNREEKRVKQKEKEIHEIRVIAARRIVPKEMSPAQRDRLDQLRGAQARRAMEGGDGNDEFDHQSSAAGSFGPGGMVIDMDRRSLSEKVTDRLRAHGTRKRFFVMTLCLSLFFILVNPDLLRAAVAFILPPASGSADNTSEQLEKGKRTWWSPILGTTGFLFYLLLCTIMHFATCDIALVYAYDALELGSKSGKEVRKYYSDNVRIVMAGMSFGIYALSVGKAISRIVLSFSVAGTFAVYISSSDWLLMAWKQMLEMSGVTIESAAQNTTLIDAMRNETLTMDNEEMLVDSTATNSTGVNDAQSAISASLMAIVAQLFTWTIGGVIRRILESGYTSSLLAYFVSKLDVGDFEDSVASWQADALNTASIMYSYTLIPLVIFLLLFNYSARQARPSDAKKTAESPATATTVTSPQETTASSDYTSDVDLPQPRALNLDTEASPNPQVFCKPLRKRNRRGFRLRKQTVSNLEVVPESSELGRPQRKNTM
mmetsp:Transcript_17862/g.41826  ORF Transcript_17862/g.41826 Transcript_17862/m.41826 type:complete len:948 (+) Transcript_17862:275-3118(+)